jgi:N-acetylglucosamine-6-sulfatase
VRNPLVVACALVVAVACTGVSERPAVASATTVRSATAAGTTRPNVVIILLDDATPQEMERLPKLQSLVAAHGTTFPNYFDSTPICCPARAGILSGQYNTNNGVRDNHSAPRFAHDNQLASWLQDAGYQTALLGKYLNGFPCVGRADIPRGWDSWQQVCDANESQYDYVMNDNGRKVRHGSRPKDYMVDVLRQHMTRTIQTFSAKHRPFFLYVAPTVPHSPPQVPPRYAHAQVPVWPKPASFDEADLSDKPWLKKLPRIKQTWEQFFRIAEAPRMRMNLSVDDMVEAAVSSLQRAHALDNTVLMVLNDNGYMRGEHRLAYGKGLPYYEALTSGPLYVRGPGFPAGVVDPALLGNVDLAPTITRLAQAKARRVMDGVDFMPAVRNPTLFADRAYFHFLPDWGVITGVRVGDRYAFFRFHDNCCYGELYDYQTDPNHTEMTNVATDPKYTLLKLALIKLTNRLARCHGRSCALTFSRTGHIGHLPR